VVAVSLKNDPLGGMNVTRNGVAAMTRSLLSVAGDCCSGRCAAVLEGGYSLEGLKEGASALLDAMGGDGEPVPPGQGSNAAPVISEVQKAQRRFWEF
jgi:acetoin utilization deacetylase AcuC-like enzyme